MNRPGCTYLRLTRAHLGEPWQAPGHTYGPMRLTELLDTLRPKGWRLDCIGGGDPACLINPSAVVLYRAEATP